MKPRLGIVICALKNGVPLFVQTFNIPEQLPEFRAALDKAMAMSDEGEGRWWYGGDADGVTIKTEGDEG